MEVSAQLEKVCIGSATALGERPDQQVMHISCALYPQLPNPKGTVACRKLFGHAECSKQAFAMPETCVFQVLASLQLPLEEGLIATAAVVNL